MTPLDYMLVVGLIGSLGVLGMSTAEHADGRDRPVRTLDSDARRLARRRLRQRIRAIAFVVLIALAVGWQIAPRAALPTLPAVAGATR